MRCFPLGPPLCLARVRLSEPTGQAAQSSALVMPEMITMNLPEGQDAGTGAELPAGQSEPSGHGLHDGWAASSMSRVVVIPAMWSRIKRTRRRCP